LKTDNVVAVIQTHRWLFSILIHCSSTLLLFSVLCLPYLERVNF
jgi:hypothetical protein